MNMGFLLTYIEHLNGIHLHFSKKNPIKAAFYS